jgi:hypothetical protein
VTYGLRTLSYNLIFLLVWFVGAIGRYETSCLDLSSLREVFFFFFGNNYLNTNNLSILRVLRFKL